MKNYHEKENKNRTFHIILISIGACFLIGCGSYKCTVQTHELIDSVYAILIKEKICRDVNECRTKNYVLCRSSKDACISVYGITDASIIKKIVDLCIEKKTINPKLNYELYVYPKMKEEDYNQKPTLKLILQEE